MKRPYEAARGSIDSKNEPDEGVSKMDGYRGDDIETSMFQPDTLLGFEYFETQRSRRQLDPEHSLVLAVLEDALSCYKENFETRNKKKKRQFDQAEAWIFNRNERSELCFSFDYVCEVLGLDPGGVRKRLRHWKAAKLKELEVWNKDDTFIRCAENWDSIKIRDLHRPKRQPISDDFQKQKTFWERQTAEIESPPTG